MIERLARALEHVDDLPPEAQVELAEQIEGFSRRASPRMPQQRSVRGSFAGIWRDLPDDMEETLFRWRRESTLAPPIEDQRHWVDEATDDA
jgi:hypothetical protein